MTGRLNLFILAIFLTASGILHIWEYRKIREFSDNFAVQSQIELKRTALMVLYQEIIQNMAKQIDILRKQEPDSMPELKLEEEKQ